MLKWFFIEDQSPLCLDPLAEIVGSLEGGCIPEDDHHDQHHRHKPVIFIIITITMGSMIIANRDGE